MQQKYNSTAESGTASSGAHLAGPNDNNLVRPLDSTQPVRDEDHRHAPPRDHVVDRLLHQVFALCV